MMVKKSAFFVCIVVILNIVAVVMVKAPLRFGYKAADGALIQPYYLEDGFVEDIPVEVPVFIPQYVSVLEYDEFIFYVEFEDAREHNITFTLYQLETVEVTEFNNETGNYETFNRTGYTLELGVLEKNLKNGMNAEGEDYYAEFTINQESWDAFNGTDVRRKVVIEYLDLEIVFYHETNPAFVTVSQNRGQWQGLLIVTLFSLAFLIIVAIKVAKRLQQRIHGIWFEVSTSFLALIISWSMLGILLLIIIYGLTENDIARQIAVLPIPALELVIACAVGIWTPAEFQQKPNKMYVMEWDFKDNPFEDIVKFQTHPEQLESKATSMGMKIFYFYKRGKNVYFFEKRNNFKELIQTIILGPRKLNGLDETFSIQSRDEKDFVKFTRGIEKEMKSLTRRQILLFAFTEAMLLSLVIGLLAGAVIMGFTGSQQLVAGLLAGIILSILLLIAFVRRPAFFASAYWKIREFFEKLRETEYPLQLKKTDKFLTLCSSLEKNKPEIDVNDRTLQLKVGVPAFFAVLFILAGALNPVSGMAPLFASLSFVAIIAVMSVVVFEYIRLREEFSIEPLSRNTIHAIYDANLVQEAEKNYQVLTNEHAKLKRENYLMTGAILGGEFVEWEMILTGKTEKELPELEVENQPVNDSIPHEKNRKGRGRGRGRKTTKKKKEVKKDVTT